MEMAPEMSRRPTVKKVAQAKKVQSRSGSVQNRTVQSRMRQRPTDSSPSQSGVAVQGEGTLSQSEVQRRVREDIRPGDVPDSAKIVSVTDRVVGESEGSGETTSLAEGSSSDEPQSLPSKGWVARRPTPEIVR
ncbi:MAG: hypothetical protein LLF97_06590 [Planctomycetaceae bacterium]|nr:hypothetical protein [Planctomycetaceae bacterium]